jgi:hypothetical protein
MSYSFIGLFGCKGSGKSYSMFQIQDAYQQQAKAQHIDLNDPFSSNGAITHVFYVSPSIATDLTLRNDKEERILVEGDDDNIKMLTDMVYSYAKDVQFVLDAQIEIRDFFQNKAVQQQIDKIYKSLTSNNLPIEMNKIENEYYTKVIRLIRVVEEHKLKQYSFGVSMAQLQIPETEKSIIKYINMIYELIGLTFNGMWIRKAKMIIMLDDLSGTALFQNITSNKFYKMLTQQRHLSIYSICMAIHGMSVAYSNFRTLMTSVLLFNGLKKTQVVAFFNDISVLHSPKF